MPIKINTTRYYELPDSSTELVDNLYVWSEICDQSMQFKFMNFVSFDGDTTYVETIMSGRGCIGLRECRHTYWGENGYIYYLNGQHLITIISWLKNHFDLD